MAAKRPPRRGHVVLLQQQDVRHEHGDHCGGGEPAPVERAEQTEDDGDQDDDHPDPEGLEEGVHDRSP